jgi:hypothetical protein
LSRYTTLQEPWQDSSRTVPLFSVFAGCRIERGDYLLESDALWFHEKHFFAMDEQ